MITKAQKHEWVKALRSGKYRQCVRRIKNGGRVPSYCCLGVARELFPDAKRGRAEAGHISYQFLDEWEQRKLVNLNDGRTPFPEIADWIEANVRAKGEE
jgi:hypothetical protein